MWPLHRLQHCDKPASNVRISGFWYGLGSHGGFSEGYQDSTKGVCVKVRAFSQGGGRLARPCFEKRMAYMSVKPYDIFSNSRMSTTLLMGDNESLGSKYHIAASLFSRYKVIPIWSATCK